MTLEEVLKESLDFIAGCFLVSELGSDLPVRDPFPTFADDETIIGTQAFCGILNDGVACDFPLTVWA